MLRRSVYLSATLRGILAWPFNLEELNKKKKKLNESLVEKSQVRPRRSMDVSLGLFHPIRLVYTDDVTFHFHNQER